MTVSKERSSLKFNDFREVDAAANTKFKDFEYAWHGKNHTLPTGNQLTIKDALAMYESPLFIPKVINNVIQEAAEPLLVGTGLLERIQFQPGTMVDMPVMGAVDGDFDVGEEESFPELRVTYGPGHQIARIGKQGVAVKFTEEVIRYSQFDVVTMAVRQAARALARNKEEKIFKMLYAVARTTHDNVTPAASAFGTTTGRALDGSLNGSITMDDIFEMFAQVMHNGWIPDMLLVHPLTWLMFVQDAQLKAFAQAAGGPLPYGQWSGQVATQDFPSSFGGEGATGGIAGGVPGAANTTPKASNQMTAGPMVPSYLGMPLRVVVSPFVPYNAGNNTTDILLADSSQLGFYIEDHAAQTDEWQDPDTDILKIKIKERFTLREKNRGLGMAVAKNVVVASNQIVLPAQASIDVAGAIGVANRGVAVP
jgi:hypothetical protein